MHGSQYINLLTSAEGKTFKRADDFIAFSRKIAAVEMQDWRQVMMRYLNYNLRHSVTGFEDKKKLLSYTMKFNNPRFDSHKNYQYYENSKGTHLSFKDNKTLDEFRILYKVYVDHLDISGSSVRDFDFLTSGKYKTLNLSHTPFSLLWVLETLKEVKKINLSHTSIKEINHLRYSPVEELNLSHCKMLNSLKGLSQASKLKKIIISKDMLHLVPKDPKYEVSVIP